MLVGAERAGGYSFRAAEVAVLMLTKVDPPLFGWAADVTGKSNEEVLPVMDRFPLTHCRAGASEESAQTNRSQI
jgi:hypothetical protein